MTRHRGRRRLLLGTVALLLACPLWAQRAGDERREPSTHEIELWRSATRLDDAQGYEAYLGQFPNGAFAEMARLAIRKLAAAGAASVPLVQRRLADRARLGSLQSLPMETGALTTGPGTVLVGPGVVTVGWLGAKKQMVVPRGEWVVLTAYDHRLSGFASLQMTTLALAQFDVDRLTGLVATTFNSRSPPVVPGSAAATNQVASLIPAWPAEQECQGLSKTAFHHAAESSYRWQKCAAVRELGPGDALALAPDFRERIERALVRLGVALPAFVVRSEVHVGNDKRDYIGYVRLDPATQSGAPPQAEARALMYRRRPWVDTLLPLAVKGHARGIDAADLEPETPQLPARITIDD